MAKLKIPNYYSFFPQANKFYTSLKSSFLESSEVDIKYSLKIGKTENNVSCSATLIRIKKSLSRANNFLILPNLAE
ncbi:MAG: hypothetical protein F6K40_26475 [Okeania sp. SIO3I5]|uniref:hypothetical protein n=1 Tax=Okeania sp. SIO3I5 TaxID=2607805 RepID=UPI0013B79807|nr:hypothetical protein [Okeania sp. SIO3I5]NEQ39607.1 hypothetical protein [Okeania sp. SIO3I5]